MGEVVINTRPYCTPMEVPGCELADDEYVERLTNAMLPYARPLTGCADNRACMKYGDRPRTGVHRRLGRERAGQAEPNDRPTSHSRSRMSGPEPPGGACLRVPISSSAYVEAGHR